MFHVFISHASEDKDAIARPLADLLIKNDVKVWYDEYELKIGDSLRKSIDKGLNNSDFGIVILSPSFFNKNWTDYELNSLVTMELVYSRKVILPIWHNVEINDVIKYSPSLADKLAASTEYGLESVADKILTTLNLKQAPLSNFYELNKNENIKLNWGTFNSERIFENIELFTENNMVSWRIASTQKEDVGVNLFNLPSKGVVQFEYYILEMNFINPKYSFLHNSHKKGWQIDRSGF